MLSFRTDSHKFRKILPLLQIVTTMLFIWMYYADWRIVTPLVIRTPAGERTFMVHGNPNSYSRQLDWVQAINFPAGWVVLPAELAATKGEGGDSLIQYGVTGGSSGLQSRGYSSGFLRVDTLTVPSRCSENARRSCQQQRTGFSQFVQPCRDFSKLLLGLIIACTCVGYRLGTARL
jgi:hypothetical protein